MHFRDGLHGFIRHAFLGIGSRQHHRAPHGLRAFDLTTADLLQNGGGLVGFPAFF